MKRGCRSNGRPLATVQTSVSPRQSVEMLERRIQLTVDGFLLNSGLLFLEDLSETGAEADDHLVFTVEDGDFTLRRNGSLVIQVPASDVTLVILELGNSAESFDSVTTRLLQADTAPGFQFEVSSVLEGVQVLAHSSDVPLRFNGGTGDDTILGSRSADTLVGGGGNDFIHGRAGADSIMGSEGTDTIRGGHSHDTLVGGSGNDVLIGQYGHDRLDGGDGDDRLRGGIGDDTFVAGSGNDRIIAASGNDTVEVTVGTSDVTVASHTVTLSNGTELRVRGAETLVLIGDGVRYDTTGAGAYHLISIQDGSGDAEILGSVTGRMLIDAGDGNDTIVTGSGDDTILAGGGDDSVDPGAGTNVLNSGGGFDTLATGAGGVNMVDAAFGGFDLIVDDLP